MAQSQIPIAFNEFINLSSPPLSIPLENVEFGSCSMESDKFITVCETGQSQIAIVELSAGNTVSRQKISAEAAIMNPLSKVIVMKGGQVLHIFNLESHAKVKSYNMPAPVTFWRWVAPNSIALVTATFVFHWSIEGDTAPVKIFDRNPALTDGNQIINYQVSGDGKWCLLYGISAGATPGVINGNMQLHSIEKSVSQMLQGRTGVFSVLNVPGREERAQVLVLVFEDKQRGQAAKLFFMEVGRDKTAPGGVFRVTPQAIPTAPDAPNDFPVTMNASKTQGVVYTISKKDSRFLFDIFSGKPVYRARITMDTVFSATEHSASGGVLAITRKGQVLQVSLNESTLVPYIVGQLRDQQLAIDIASRLNLSGADDLYAVQFNNLIATGDVQGAAKVAAESPRGLLRTPNTIMRFQQVPPVPGQPQPVSQYFSVLLEKGKLNRLESIELAEPVIQQGRAQLLEKWISEDKLFMSEELGDLVMTVDINMALTIFLRANVAEKVINCYMQKGEFDKIVTYASRTSYHVDYAYMLQQLVRSNPEGALDFAKKLANNESGVQLIDANTVLEIFMSVSLLREATAFLLGALKGNRKGEGFLQTKLLEINFLGGMPQVADAILGNEMFSHYDKAYIGRQCEQTGLADSVDFTRIKKESTYWNDKNICLLGEIGGDRSTAQTRYPEHSVQLKAAPLPCRTPRAPGAVLGGNMHLSSLGGLLRFPGTSLVPAQYIAAAACMQKFPEVSRSCRESTVCEPECMKAKTEPTDIPLVTCQMKADQLSKETPLDSKLPSSPSSRCCASELSVKVAVADLNERTAQAEVTITTAPVAIQLAPHPVSAVHHGESAMSAVANEEEPLPLLAEDQDSGEGQEYTHSTDGDDDGTAADLLTVVVGDQTGLEAPTRIARTAHLDTALQAYADQKGWPLSACTFRLDGVSVRTKDTPETLGMEDNTRIDAFAPHVGGGDRDEAAGAEDGPDQDAGGLAGRTRSTRRKTIDLLQSPPPDEKKLQPRDSFDRRWCTILHAVSPESMALLGSVEKPYDDTSHTFDDEPLVIDEGYESAGADDDENAAETEAPATVTKDLSSAFESIQQAPASIAPASKALKVVLRLKPLGAKEKGTITVNSTTKITTSAPGSSVKHTFKFSEVFDEMVTQEQVYRGTAEALVLRLCDGEDGAVCAYGATGSGKTHTMLGPDSDPGLLYRAVEGIEHEMKISSADGTVGKWNLQVSMLQIYNDGMYDLLAKKKGAKDKLDHRIYDGRVEVENLTQVTIATTKDVKKLIKKAAANRETSSTAVNATSSRSHCVNTLTLTTTDNNSVSRSATLQVVDLAGAEQSKKTEATALQQKESIAINQPLLALIQCLEDLEKKAKNPEITSPIPYRRNLLTMLLMPILCGVGVAGIVILTCVNQRVEDFRQSKSILGYATKASKIEHMSRLGTATASSRASTSRLSKTLGSSGYSASVGANSPRHGSSRSMQRSSAAADSSPSKSAPGSPSNSPSRRSSAPIPISERRAWGSNSSPSRGRPSSSSESLAGTKRPASRSPSPSPTRSRAASSSNKADRSPGSRDRSPNRDRSASPSPGRSQSSGQRSSADAYGVPSKVAPGGQQQSWVSNRLLAAGVSASDIRIVEKALIIKEKFRDEGLFMRCARSSLTTTRLAKAGIKELGLQQNVLDLHALLQPAQSAVSTIVPAGAPAVAEHAAMEQALAEGAASGVPALDGGFQQTVGAPATSTSGNSQHLRDEWW